MINDLFRKIYIFHSMYFCIQVSINTDNLIANYKHGMIAKWFLRTRPILFLYGLLDIITAGTTGNMSGWDYPVSLGRWVIVFSGTKHEQNRFTISYRWIFPLERANKNEIGPSQSLFLKIQCRLYFPYLTQYFVLGLKFLVVLLCKNLRKKVGYCAV